MELSVKLDSFEGPLDLLLHLIDKNKINIYDIPISLITEQYMEVLAKMQEEKLENIVRDYAVNMERGKQIVNEIIKTHT